MRAARLARGSAVLLLLLAASCGSHDESADPDEGAGPVVPVRTIRLEQRMFRDQVTAQGAWRSTNALVVSAPFAAYVEALRADVGSVVTAGDTLALLATQESRAAVIGAEQLVAAAADPAARAEAERALRQARRDVVRVPVVAAAPGTVVRGNVMAGALVAEGAELMAIVSAQNLVFEAHVPLREAGRVAVGQSAIIEMEDGSKLGASVLQRVPQTSPGDQSALVWLAAREAASIALLDRFGTADIAVGAPHRALAVSDSALVEDDLTGQIRIACVGADSVATWTTVRLGAGAEGWHEVLAPELDPECRAIVSGQRGLPDSTRVTIEP